MDEMLLNILFIVLVVFIVTKVVGSIGTKKEHCKLHKWSTDITTGKLVCQECSYVSGSHQVEDGDY